MTPKAPAAPHERIRCLPILEPGCCEPLKATVHGTALGLATLMAAYNVAAWLQRRQRHLAINSLIYTVAAVWESSHVRHHIHGCRTSLNVSDGSAQGQSSENRQAA
jgi:hypothetical protein